MPFAAMGPEVGPNPSSFPVQDQEALTMAIVGASGPIPVLSVGMQQDTRSNGTVRTRGIFVELPNSASLCIVLSGIAGRHQHWPLCKHLGQPHLKRLQTN